MMKCFLSALLVLGSLSIFAQVTEDRTQVLDKEHGTPIFVLRAGEKLYSYAPENGWYKVRKKVVVRLQDMDGKLMNPGTTLRNEKGDSIGYTTTELKAKEVGKIERLRENDLYEAILEGWLFKTKLADNSVPEEALEKILATKNRREQQEGLEEFMSKYSFEERKFDDLVAFAYKEENKRLGKEQDFRIILIYRGGTTLYAFITNGHEVPVPKSKEIVEDGDFTTTYFYKPTSAQRESIQQDILYTFLAL